MKKFAIYIFLNYNNDMKRFARVMCAVFVAMFVLLGTGCSSGSSNFHQNLLDRFHNGELTYDQLQTELERAQTVPLYGTKVLYRPNHYDYDNSVGEGNESYYGQYAWNILSNLSYIYGFSDFNRFNPTPQKPTNTIRPLLIDKTQEYYYDSIRYQVTNKTTTNNLIIYTQDDNGSEEIDGILYSKNEFEDIIKMTANTSFSWNWTFGSEAIPLGFIHDMTYSVYSKPSIANSLISNAYIETPISNYYSNNQTPYSTAYLGTAEQTGIDSYSDYVKALEYVIYCITMDLTPSNITTSLASDGTPIINVQGFENVDAALEFIKGVFDKIGTYVGLNSYKTNRLISYILNNVIGQNALSHDTVQSYTANTLIEYRDANGNVIDTQEEGKTLNETITVGRNYTAVVSAIINDSFQYVHIGSDSENDIITNRFPASEVIDYYGNNFFIASEKGKEFEHIGANEYQSAVLMLSEEQKLDNLMVHFKYDAGEDGDEVYDKNASITINVKVNYYKHGGEWKQLKTQSITVKDGPFNYGKESSTLCLFGIAPDKKGFKIGKFNPEVGGGILKCMVDYDGTTAISDPVRLVGTTKLKDWYKLVEPEPTDEPQNAYYSYGILNHEKFTGSDGCDYFEIAFEVVQTTGDYNTNYKFYTGLGLVA